MAVPPCDGNGTLLNCKFVNVETCGKVYGCGHGTELVYSHQVVFEGYRRRLLRVKLPCNCTVLDIQRFRIISNNYVWLCRSDFRAADLRFPEAHSVDIIGSSTRT